MREPEANKNGAQAGVQGARVPVPHPPANRPSPEAHLLARKHGVTPEAVQSAINAGWVRP